MAAEMLKFAPHVGKSGDTAQRARYVMMPSLAGILIEDEVVEWAALGVEPASSPRATHHESAIRRKCLRVEPAMLKRAEMGRKERLTAAAVAFEVHTEKL